MKLTPTRNVAEEAGALGQRLTQLARAVSRGDRRALRLLSSPWLADSVDPLAVDATGTRDSVAARPTQPPRPARPAPVAEPSYGRPLYYLDRAGGI